MEKTFSNFFKLRQTKVGKFTYSNLMNVDYSRLKYELQWLKLQKEASKTKLSAFIFYKERVLNSNITNKEFLKKDASHERDVLELYNKSIDEESIRYAGLEVAIQKLNEAIRNFKRTMKRAESIAHVMINIYNGSGYTKSFEETKEDFDNAMSNYEILKNGNFVFQG